MGRSVGSRPAFGSGLIPPPKAVMQRFSIGIGALVRLMYARQLRGAISFALMQAINAKPVGIGHLMRRLGDALLAASPRMVATVKRLCWIPGKRLLPPGLAGYDVRILRKFADRACVGRTANAVRLPLLPRREEGFPARCARPLSAPPSRHPPTARCR